MGVIDMTTKYIVRYFKELPDDIDYGYWTEEGNGVTEHRELAHQYTAEELRTHDFACLLKSGRCVAIPITNKEDT